MNTGIVTIPITQGYHAIIDAGLADLINQHSWQAHFNSSGLVYARRDKRINGKKKHIPMQVEIYEFLHGPVPPGRVVDHANQTTLDNRGTNLRLLTRGGNGANSRQRRPDVPQGVEVRKNKRITTYRARVKVDGKRIHLGTFLSMAEAAERAREARRHYFGI